MFVRSATLTIEAWPSPWLAENAYGQPVVNLDIEHGGARHVPVPLVVWPNPSAGMINIQASGGEMVRVYDMLGFAEDGRVRCSAQITGDHVAIGFSNCIYKRSLRSS